MPEIPENFAGQILAHRLNFSPYIGYGQDNYAPVHCYANYVARDWGLPSFAFMDGEGKIVMYFSAVDKEGRSQVFRAHQRTLFGTTIFVNEPVRPPFVEEHELVESVRGLGTYFVCLYLTDDTPEQRPTRVIIVRTRSSDPVDWTDCIETKRPYVDEYSGGSTFYYDHKSGNVLRAWPDGGGHEMWYALYDSTLFRSRQLIRPTKLFDAETDLNWEDPTNRLVCSKESARIDPLSTSMTYDRFRGDMIVMFSVTFRALDTHSGHPLRLRRTLVLNHKMSESTLADGQGLVLNNIPYGEGENYRLLPHDGMNWRPSPPGLYMSEHAVIVQPEENTVATVGFNEYYEGSVSVAEQIGYGGWRSVRYREFDVEFSFTGADHWRPDRTHHLGLEVKALPSNVSSGFTKAVAAVDGRLIMCSRGTISEYMVSDSDIARIEPGNVIRLKPDHTHTTAMSDPLGKHILSKLYRLTTIVERSGGPSKSFGVSAGIVHRIYKQGNALNCVATSFVMPELPLNAPSGGAWTFNANSADPTFWVLGFPQRWNGTQKEGHAVVYEHNRKHPDTGYGKGWKEYKTVIDPEGITQAMSETSSAPLRAVHTASVMFTERGHLAIITCWRADGPFGTDPTVSLFDPATDTVVGSFRVRPQRGPHTLGWHPMLGYFVADDVEPGGLVLRAQGHASYEQFWIEGVFTSYFLPVDRANPNTITVGQMPVFLGGRFSEYAGGCVPLPLNQRTYVYLEREREAPYNIEIRTTDSLLPNTFDRVLISEIEADDIGAISQKDHPVNWKS